MEVCLAVPPLPWPALAGAPRAAGFAARILGYGHRSVLGRSTSTALIELDGVASRVAIGPLPCPAPSDAIRAPRPSFRRSSMPAVPAAAWSFPTADADGSFRFQPQLRQRPLSAAGEWAWVSL